MSKMFKDAVETHIEQLKNKITGADPRHIDEELKSASVLVAHTTDSRLRKALEKRVSALESQRTNAGGVEDHKKILSAVQNVYSLIRNRPEYNVVRRKRGEGKRARKPRG
jgi:hypothetical protein